MPFSLFVMKMILLAEIRKTFGLKGEVLCFLHTDFPKLRFKKGNSVFLVKGESQIETTISSYRDSGDYCYLSFEGLKDIASVEPYIKWDIMIPEEKAVLPEGMVRYEDIFASDVYDQDGNKLGHAIELIDNCATKSLRVRRDGNKDFFVPWLPKVFIKEVDEINHKIIINVIPGMLD